MFTFDYNENTTNLLAHLLAIASQLKPVALRKQWMLTWDLSWWFLCRDFNAFLNEDIFENGP